MSASERRAARHAHTSRYGDARARDAVSRSSAGVPRRRSATDPRRWLAADRSAAATHRPNGRRRHVPFDFDRLRAWRRASSRGPPFEMKCGPRA
ncbi:hypothetical protein CFB44_16345 [Burkholderia sp. AU31280]|nr:hypothetical protein CFB44_16345 [Burkholderia sp. AU31280]